MRRTSGSCAFGWYSIVSPVSGVFALLARLAPIHFRVDRERWSAYPHRTDAVDCAPLLDVKRMKGSSQCHACGRCAGHRDAVELAVRSPNAEILSMQPPQTSAAILLIFGMLGVATGAFQWTVNPWFVKAKLAAATWLIERDVLWPLDSGAPWWLLTHYEEVGDVFTWLDGALILVYILTAAVSLGGMVWLGVFVAARIAHLDWRRLALALTPLAGIGLFLGLSMMTATHLRAEGVNLSWLPAARGALLALGVTWSCWLGLRLAAANRLNAARLGTALVAHFGAVGVVATAWILVFYVW